MKLRREGLAADLHAQVDRFLADRWGPARVRSSTGELGQLIDLLGTIRDLGWTELLVPESAGGIGAGVVEAGGLFESFGYHLAPTALFDAIVVTPTFRGLGLVEADAHVAFAGVLPGGRGAVGWRGAHVDRDGLTGHHVQVDLAPHATDFAVLAERDGEPIIAVVSEPDHVVAVAQRSSDASHRPYELRYRQTPCVVVEGGAAPQVLERVRQLAHAMYAAQLVGLMDRMTELARTYALEREQFGRPIGSFQALQVLLAEMVVARDSSRNTTYAAQALLADGATTGPRIARSAKAHASRSAVEVAERAMQVFGGIGYSAEHDLHLYLKRALTVEAAWGGHRHHAVTTGSEILA